MLEFLDNQIAGCIALFILVTVSLWYIKPRLIFNDEGEVNELYIGNYHINIFGVCVIFIAIIVYYFYAMIRYNF
jgi:hypothetical protein